MKKLPVWFLSILVILLFFPIVMTFVYSISTEWHSTILPEGITFEWYGQILGDPRFHAAVLRTFMVSAGATLLSLAIMVPTVFIVVLHFPKLEKALQLLVLMPYAIPGVIGAVGLIQIYSNTPIPISGTVWILLGAYFIVVLPFMYQGIRNSLRNINAIALIQAASTLGVSERQAFLYVIIPNLKSGIMISALLSFSTLFGEFVLAQLLVGGGYETVQVYLSQMISMSGHGSSAIVIIYFMFVLMVSVIALRLSKHSNVRKVK